MLTTPGMKHSEESGQVAAYEFIICRKDLQCLRRSGEHGGIGFFLVASKGCAQLFRDGKGDHKVVSRQLPVKLAFEPLSGFMVLADRAMTVAAGAKTDMDLAAALAIVDHQAACGGST